MERLGDYLLTAGSWILSFAALYGMWKLVAFLGPKLSLMLGL